MKTIINILKATIISIIVAFLFISVISFTVITTCKGKFEMATSLLKLITVDNENVHTLTPELQGNILINYPTYGSKYATLKINSIDVNLPVYYGANYSTLKSGVAHDNASYFPGEGGSIIFAGHNFKTFLAKLPQAKIGDKIEVETTYGTFNYQIYNTKIIQETAIQEVPVQDKKEILMIYTCYPINNIGHASQRYVVYANLIKD